MPRITVIGAGVAGCTISYLLNEEGFDVTLVEKDAVGGLLREIEFDTGYHCDSAPHLLFFDEEEEAVVGDLFSEFTHIEPHDFYAATYPRGDLEDPHHYPVSKQNIDRWDDADQIREELAAAPGKTDAEFFEEYMKNQVGQTLYDRYNKNYTEKHWGVDPKRITGDWFDFKISFPEEEQEFFGDGAYYPDDKYTDILETMISDCDVVFDGVTGLETTGDRIDALETESGDRIGGDLFISTIDPSLVVDTTESLNYRSMVILGTHVSADERLFPDHVDWGYFPNDYEFTRVTDYEFVPQETPDGEYILTTEFPCFIGDDVWSNDDEWYTDYLHSFLEEQGIDAEILDSKVRRAPRAYPLPVTEEIETFERINSQLSAHENMFNLGRVSTYEYIWIKDIVQQAYETRDDVLAHVGAQTAD
ncbi:protoporphyrinogen/coproporphyrinogen oxidase [Haloarcula onubensis]|uniref:NAD(P)-binding protein n=1 Tax=Haloarcula onubensis TaxID=2950539 RepID=A0ABU2FUT9_9EURY|nr:UDP-galactopyranose mutase [Halomicroarcula sp. S3CR25-11]MDS0284525.1 NAD(P)-binding protein [Halomicroarcula sp. S3CR25-11]